MLVGVREEEGNRVESPERKRKVKRGIRLCGGTHQNPQSFQMTAKLGFLLFAINIFFKYRLDSTNSFLPRMFLDYCLSLLYYRFEFSRLIFRLCLNISHSPLPFLILLSCKEVKLFKCLLQLRFNFPSSVS